MRHVRLPELVSKDLYPVRQTLRICAHPKQPERAMLHPFGIFGGYVERVLGRARRETGGVPSLIPRLVRASRARSHFVLVFVGRAISDELVRLLGTEEVVDVEDPRIGGGGVGGRFGQGFQFDLFAVSSVQARDGAFVPNMNWRPLKMRPRNLRSLIQCSSIEKVSARLDDLPEIIVEPPMTKKIVLAGERNQFGLSPTSVLVHERMRGRSRLVSILGGVVAVAPGSRLGI
mmetsp:Transcript_1904/g.4728  ORF Transcript_1904/g.4728 Transcript_1904/m.4728 type:complete len:231 (-) Transcript_1904:383-1075(-)